MYMYYVAAVALYICIMLRLLQFVLAPIKTYTVIILLPGNVKGTDDLK